MSSAISKRYAKALVELGAEEGMVERYGDELQKIVSVFAAEEPLRLLMESPTFQPEKKKAILADLANALDLSTGIRKFLGLLLEKDRLQYLPHIAQEYRALADERSGILRARVLAATQLADAQRKAISAGLEERTGKKVELTSEIDPSLIGGLQVEFGGKLFDGSLKTQLKRIEDSLQKG